MNTFVPLLLAVIGLLTALAGLAALLPPALLNARLPLDPLSPAGWFFVRHWGVLVLVCGLALSAAAFIPAWREPVILIVGVEKLAFAALALSQRQILLRQAIRAGGFADLLAAGLLAVCWFAL